MWRPFEIKQACIENLKELNDLKTIKYYNLRELTNLT